MSSGERVRMRRPGAPGPRGGGVYVPQAQRRRLLDATLAVVAEQGYRRMTVRRVSGWAGVSNKTFYDLFEDGEDCFLATFDLAVEHLASAVVPAWGDDGDWAARVRVALIALLDALEDNAALRSLVFVEALGAGPRVLQRRAALLEGLASAIDVGRVGVKVGEELPPLTAEGIVSAAFGVIHARILDHRPGSLGSLANSLMAMIVLPYRGRRAAARELSRILPGRAKGASSAGVRGWVPRVSAPRPVELRLTVRTYAVLGAVAERPGASNRAVSDAAGVSDQGQISKLLARLEGRGLLRNCGGRALGAPNEWWLTAKGEEILRANRREYEVAVSGVER